MLWIQNKIRSLDLKELARFLFVGGSATITYAVLFYALVEFAQFSGALSSAFAYAIAIPISYFGQKYLTFDGKKQWKEDAGRFFVVQGLNFFISLTISFIALDFFGWQPVVSIIIVLLFVPISNYILFKFWVFDQFK